MPDSTQEFSSKVLVVDDQPDNLVSIEKILQPLGVDTLFVSSIREILNLISKHAFAVILISVDISKINGCKIVKLINSNNEYQNIPIIIVTNSDCDQNVILKIYEYGAAGYIQWPVNELILRNTVKPFIDLHLQRLNAEKALNTLQITQAKNDILLNSTDEGILGLDVAGNITFTNPKACVLLSTDKEYLLTAHISDFFVALDWQPLDINNDDHHADWESSPIRKTLQKHQSSHINNERWRTAKGDIFYVEYHCKIMNIQQDGNVCAILIFQNINNRKAAEEQLMFLSNYDSLTQLANRTYFHDSLSRALARSKRTKSSIAVLTLNLDNFKIINDTYGHNIGDLLLQTVSEKLKNSIRAGDLVARLGGDEFAFILHDIHNAENAAQVAEIIIEDLSQPITILDNDIITGASIGISLCEKGNSPMDSLIKSANTAMHVAKSSGKNHFQFFSENMQKRITERNKILIKLHHAISNQEYFIQYQPKISVSKQKMVGLEALIRWRSDGNIIPPDIFIPIAEESDQIKYIGEWVLTEVCKNINEWQSTLKNYDYIVSINVSAKQLTNSDFYHILKNTLDNYIIQPQLFEVEVTETAVMNNPDIAIEQLNKIHELGVHISIDDFGTGYSSLSYLRKLPLDILKIDRSFVKYIGIDKNDEAIVKAIIAVAEALSIEVIAEGVETSEQLNFLANANCDIVQGYYFSPPQVPEKIISYMTDSTILLDEPMTQYQQLLNQQNMSLS